MAQAKTAAIVSILLFLTGCKTWDGAVIKESVRAVVEQHTGRRLNADGQFEQFTYWSTNYVTNFVANPYAKDAIESLNIIPGWGSLASLILGGALGAYTSFKNRRRAEAVAKALVTATEAGRLALRKMPDGERIDEYFLKAIVREHLDSGHADDIRKIVEEHTKRTT